MSTMFLVDSNVYTYTKKHFKRVMNRHRLLAHQLLEHQQIFVFRSVAKKIFLYFLLNNRTFIIIAITFLAISESSLHCRREYTTELGLYKSTTTLKIKFESIEK